MRPIRCNEWTLRAAACALMILTSFWAGDAIAQSGGLSFRACWDQCRSSDTGGVTRECNRCLARVCAGNPSLRNHPNCRGRSQSTAPSRPPTATATPSLSPSAPVRCDVAACTEAYRTFRPSDCTYQPYEGPRRVCTKGNPSASLAAAPQDAEPQSDVAEDDFVDDELDIDPSVDEAPIPVASDDQLGCDVAACEAHYRSFRRTDCTYQPFEGPRRRCTKGDPIAAAAAAQAASADAEPTAPVDDAAFSEAELAEADGAEGAASPTVPIVPTNDDQSMEAVFDTLSNVVAPIGYGAFAAFALLRLVIARGAPLIETAGAEPPRPPRASPLLKGKRDGWRVERSSRAAFGGGRGDDPDGDER